MQKWEKCNSMCQPRFTSLHEQPVSKLTSIASGAAVLYLADRDIDILILKRNHRYESRSECYDWISAENVEQ
jgi:hypothetical protein